MPKKKKIAIIALMVCAFSLTVIFVLATNESEKIERELRNELASRISYAEELLAETKISEDGKGVTAPFWWAASGVHNTFADEISAARALLYSEPVYEYNDAVTVIENPPEYSLTETDNGFIITVLNACDYVKNLSAGDIFVFETTETNPDGLAGYVDSIELIGNDAIITVSMPESLEEIFDKFEFAWEFDLTNGLIPFEIIPVDKAEINAFAAPEINIVRVTSEYILASIEGDSWFDTSIEGEIKIYLPTVKMDISVEQKRACISVKNKAEFDLKLSHERKFDTIIPIRKIRIRHPKVQLEIPICLRITAQGEAFIEFNHTVTSEYGIRHSIPFQRTSGSFEIRDIGLNAEASAALNLQAKASVLLIPMYGIQGDLGTGVLTDTAMQENCTTIKCFVFESFSVCSVASLEEWGLLGDIELLQFEIDFSSNLPTSMWFFSDGKIYNECPCVLCEKCGTEPCICSERCIKCDSEPCLCHEQCPSCGFVPCLCHEQCPSCGKFINNCTCYRTPCWECLYSSDIWHGIPCRYPEHFTCGLCLGYICGYRSDFFGFMGRKPHGSTACWNGCVCDWCCNIKRSFGSVACPLCHSIY
ncbi:MAG: hypothetical protein FWD19_01875 [Defluviitaleaceae bacterium]|nr:hypothetical protein [Defluviitaleaceae bacterium]